MSNYQKTLDFLYTQLPMYQRVGPMAFKKDLTNIQALLKALGNPQQQFASIHVGGTNGKGTVAHLLSAALQAGGFKTGLYTSPHYKDFRERIKIDGQYISKAFVVGFVKEIKPLLEKIRPSFFEITVAMAFTWFARQKVDLAVVEVGLGGRLDSTNVLTPELAVITNISFDHQQFLGNTLEAIAGEKAGIIKPNIPIVIGETNTKTATVFRTKATQENAPLTFADQLFQVKSIGENLQSTFFNIARKQRIYQPKLEVNLNGPFQYLNVQTALAALEIWQQHNSHRYLSFDAIEKGWRNLKTLSSYQGRWQVIQEAPTVLVDSAHNEAGIQYLTNALKKWQEERFSDQQQLHIVLGVVNDKDLAKMLPVFPKEAQYYFAKADIPRGLPAEDLQQVATNFDLKGKIYQSVRRALAAAKKSANKNDLIFVGGSVFTVAEVLP